MPSVHNNTGDIRKGLTLIEVDAGPLWLRCRSNEDIHVVVATAGDGRCKREWPVAGDRQIVAAIVLEHHPTTCAEQADDLPADGEIDSLANHLNARDIGNGCTGRVGDGTSLRWLGGLRGDCDVVAACNR